MRDDNLTFLKVFVAFGLLAIGVMAKRWLTDIEPREVAPLAVDRVAQVRHLPEHSRPLIAAIEQFEEDHGRPPTDLQELVPVYLEVIPQTGIARFPTYRYRVLTLEDQMPVLWYDLGLPPPGSPAVERYGGRLGDQGHISLELRFHGDGRVWVVQTHGLSQNLGSRAFDAECWRTDRTSRIRMAGSLVRQSDHLIKTKDDAIRLLGEPDGEGLVHDTPWELSVACHWDRWTKDKLFYWPTKNYGRGVTAYVFPIGDWQYLRGD